MVQFCGRTDIQVLPERLKHEPRFTIRILTLESIMQLAQAAEQTCFPKESIVGLEQEAAHAPAGRELEPSERRLLADKLRKGAEAVYVPDVVRKGRKRSGE